MDGDQEKVTNGDVTVELPPLLAALLVEHRGWKAARPRRAARSVAAVSSDADLPEGVTFAASAYKTVVDEATGEKIKVLKTDCRNGHPYSGDNVKIVVRGPHAYRECQTCLRGRNDRKRARGTKAAT